MGIVITWAIAAVAVWVAATFVPGIHYTDWVSIVLFAAVLGLVNALVKPIITALALPMVVLTLGLVMFIINALLFLLAAAIVPGFDVDGFLPALIGSVLVTIVTTALSAVLKDRR
jgi:putative membrane protein